MILEHSYYLWLFIFLPMLVLLSYGTYRWRKKALENYGDVELIKKLYPSLSITKKRWKYVLLLSALTLIIIGIVNPQVGSKLETVKKQGADLMICLDISNSMLAEDIQPNRLERSKLAIAKLIDDLKGDRIGLVVFAGEAFVQLPITTDYSAAKMFLESVNTEMISSQGTSIDKALETAESSFGKDNGNSKAIIVITDGENHDEHAVKIAQDISEQGIVIHTIGIGSSGGTPIPIKKGSFIVDYKKDKEGNTVISRLNEDALKQIAEAGKGIYVRASNASIGLNSIMESIEKLEKKEYENKMYTDYEDRFQWFIAPALLLLILELFMNEKKSLFFEKLNLFAEKNV